MSSVALYIGGAILGNAIFPGGGAVFAGMTGAALGGAVGGIIGSAIDQAFIFPMLNKQQDLQGQRITDISLQTATEGTGVKYCIGPMNRMAGNVIWCSDLKEVKEKKNVGGKGGGGGGSVKTYSYYVSVAVAICEGEIQSIDKIWADSKVIYDANKGPGKKKDHRSKSLTIYTGTTTQGVDPVIEAAQGADSTPAYRGIAYFVVEDLALADFGNVMPQFSCQVRGTTSISTREAIKLLLNRAGLTDDKFDATGTSGVVRGLTITGPTPTIRGLEPILLAQDVVCQENNGQLVFFDRGRAPTATVPESELAAHESGSNNDAAHPFSMADDVADGDLPKAVTVSFTEPAKDYQQGNQGVIAVHTDNKGVINYDLPIVLSAREARIIASTMLWRRWSERIIVECELPPSYIYLQEEDIISVTYQGAEYFVRIRQVDRGVNFIHKIQGVLQDVDASNGTFRDTTDAECPNNGLPPQIYLPPTALSLALLDVPGMTSADVQSPGIYAALTVESTSPFKGAALYGSSDGTTYNLIGSANVESDLGLTSDVLADGPLGYIDRASTVTVVMKEGTLESVTEEQLLTGANRMFIGSELIAFKTATLTAPKTYVLSNLLRGLRGTESFTNSHAENEYCVLYSTTTVPFQDLDLSDVGLKIYVKAVPIGGLVDDYAAVAVTFTGATMKQFAPCDLAASRDGSNNATVTWTRRTRAIANILRSVPVLASPLQYTIEVLDGSGNVLRTETASTESWAYSAANQTADGLTPGDPINVKIYQMSDIGRGYPAEATV